MTYSIVFKNGYLVDPVNDREGIFDLAIQDGRIAKVERSISADAMNVVGLNGKLVLPGLIDTHVHVTGPGRYAGYYMLARAGVTTAFDMQGPVTEILEGLSSAGTGISVAYLNGMWPGTTVRSVSPSDEEIGRFIDASLASGALGVKLLGGHYPLTPEATSKAIKLAVTRGAYVAFHAGTTEKGSNLEGLKQALELSAGNPMHLCHINAYCRGLTLGDPVLETLEALAALERHPKVVSESHLGPLNGTSGRCEGGVPVSRVTCTCLQMAGYPATEEGLRCAIADGYAVVNKASTFDVVYCDPSEGLSIWESSRGNVTVSFPVNRRSTAFLCATARNRDGSFTVEALSTDGGGIPRNYLLEMGLCLVRLGALTLKEFVRKVSSNPAKMIGLPGRGHLGEGAVADITVADLTTHRAYATIVDGSVVMFQDMIYGRGGKLLVTPYMKESLCVPGVTVEAVDIENSLLYQL